MVARHALIEPIPGVTPPNLHAGDRLELTAQSPITRMALTASGVVLLPARTRYPLVIERGAARVRLSVHAVNGNAGGLANWIGWA